MVFPCDEGEDLDDIQRRALRVLYNHSHNADKVLERHDCRLADLRFSASARLSELSERTCRKVYPKNSLTSPAEKLTLTRWLGLMK
jgi:hypothetical protein